MSENVLPVFSPGIFMVSSFKFKSLSHFELIFVYDVKVCSHFIDSHGTLQLMTPWTVAHQAPLSLEFSSQEYWMGCHFLLQGIFLTQGSNLDLFFFFLNLDLFNLKH